MYHGCCLPGQERTSITSVCLMCLIILVTNTIAYAGLCGWKRVHACKRPWVSLLMAGFTGSYPGMPGCAGLLLYLLDVAFRCAQQVQPVHVSKVAACKSATLATLHFDTDPFTPIKPVQVIPCPSCLLTMLLSSASG